MGNPGAVPQWLWSSWVLLKRFWDPPKLNSEKQSMTILWVIGILSLSTHWRASLDSLSGSFLVLGRSCEHLKIRDAGTSRSQILRAMGAEERCCSCGSLGRCTSNEALVFFLFHIYSSNRNDLQNKMWPFKNEGLTPKTNVTTGFRLHTFDMQRQKWGFSHHGDLTTQICQMFCMEGRLAEMGRKCWSRSSEKMALPFFWTWNGLYTVRVYYTSIFSLVTHHCRWTTCIYFLTYSLGISSNVHAKVWPVRWCPPSK